VIFPKREGIKEKHQDANHFQEIRELAPRDKRTASTWVNSNHLSRRGDRLFRKRGVTTGGRSNRKGKKECGGGIASGVLGEKVRVHGVWISIKRKVVGRKQGDFKHQFREDGGGYREGGDEGRIGSFQKSQGEI